MKRRIASTGLAPLQRRAHIRAVSQPTAQERTVNEDERSKLEAEIERLREEHRDLDVAIEALSRASEADRLQVQRLKKRKLALRDRLSALQDALTPDIIA
jgi:hypothetical protein